MICCFNTQVLQKSHWNVIFPMALNLLVMAACAPRNSNAILSCSFHDTFMFAESIVQKD